MTEIKRTGQLPDPEQYGEQIARLHQESKDNRRRLEFLESNYAQLRGDVQQLHNNQTKTQTLVETIFPRLDGFESRILTIFGQMTTDSAKLLQSLTRSGQQERTQAQKSWVDFAKYTISATAGAVILYLTTKGGG